MTSTTSRTGRTTRTAASGTTAGTGSIGFGFLGAGYIARTALAPAVHAADGAHLQAVAARDSGRAAALEPRGRTYDDYAAVLSDDAVDVVYIALSNDAHAPWAVRALEAGKHVLCEKPLGLDVAEVSRMTAAAAAADRLLVEAWWYRWHPRTVRAVELVRSGALGRVGRVEAEFSFDGDFDGAAAGNYRLDRARGGGAVYDVGCYAVDAARWGLQAGALEVLDAEGDLHHGVDVRASARLQAPDGSTADVRCAIRGREEQLVAVYGDEVTMVLGGRSFAARDEACALHLRPLPDDGGAADGATSSGPATRSRPDGHEADGSRAGRSLAVESTVEHFGPVDPYRLMVEATAAAVHGEDVWLPSAQDSLDIAAVLGEVRARLPRPAATG